MARDLLWEKAQEDFKAFYPGKRNYIFEFHDARQVMGALKSTRVFTASHPADFIVTSNGETFYAEVKSCSNETSFPFSMIKRSQWIAATMQLAAGGLYFFFIKSEVLGTWFKVPAKVLLDIESRKSITWKDLAPYVHRTTH
ncbi:putative holliday junction-specific endonuclease [Xylophilus phage Lumi]|nr:putative holliday junction-specific endonuclease [Xylophilus phage Lumi]